MAWCTRCRISFNPGVLQRRQPPPDTRVQFIREDNQRIAAQLPPPGKKLGGFFTVFTLFWNAITWTFVIGALSGAEEFSSSGERTWLLLFLIPFVLVGVFTALVAVFSWWGRTKVMLNHEELVIRKELAGIGWTRRYDAGRVTAVGPREAYSVNDVPVLGVGFDVEGSWLGQSVAFGTGLTQDEKDWLLAEFQDFWLSIRQPQSDDLSAVGG